MCCLILCVFILDWFWFSFVQGDDDDNYEFLAWVDEVEKLGYFKNNGIGDDQRINARLMKNVRSMVKAKESGNEEVWRGRDDGQSWLCMKWA